MNLGMSQSEEFRNVCSKAVDRLVAVLGFWNDLSLRSGDGDGQIDFQRSPILPLVILGSALR